MALEDKDFIRQRSGSSMAGEREYAIKHALTREVAYASLPKASGHACTRPSQNGSSVWERAGTTMRSSLGTTTPRPSVRRTPTSLGRTLKTSSGGLSAGVGMVAAAGEPAAGRCEIEEALELLHRAVELTEDEEQQSLIWREIGRANALKYDGEAFWTAMQTSLKVCADQTTCGDLQPARLPHLDSVGNVDAPTRARARRRLDRASARARNRRALRGSGP